jgi:hypothetical protein
MSKYTTIIQFSPELIALNEEIVNHPELQRRMTEAIANDAEMGTFENRIAMIASYCNLDVDGWLMPGELNRFADLLYNELRRKRSILILPERNTIQ